MELVAPIKIIGDDLLSRDEGGRFRTRIATAFPHQNAVVTVPGIHATQRIALTDELNRERASKGDPPLSEDAQEAIWMNGVDLILDNDTVLIRPDPADMHLAFLADEMLQQIVSKKRIKFLHVLDSRVRLAIKHRGESWRISRLPRSIDEMKRMIAGSRIGIGGAEIYYYVRGAGTRLVTCEEFRKLGDMSDGDLRKHLLEIRDNAARTSHAGGREVEFFMTRDRMVLQALMAADLDQVDDTTLRKLFADLNTVFSTSVAPEFRRDDADCPPWRSQMYASLIDSTDQEVSEEALLGMAAEFFMQVEWLPGGRIEDGELMLDSLFEEEAADPSIPASLRVCDDKARGFIFNFIRDYGDLEYVNIGRVVGSLSGRRASSGRRGVYLAEVKYRASEHPVLRIVRLQKWSVREHLDDHKDLLSAILNSDEYTEYILDRRLGCRQLGMNLSPRVTARKVSEKYLGENRRYHHQMIRSAYFERDYVPGIATDKTPIGRFADAAFAVGFARVLGRAAAPNLVTGRCDLRGNVIFDDGDELVLENPAGVPVDAIVADHTGTFGDYRRPLREVAASYARPVNKRIAWLTDPEQFVHAYLEAFVDRFRHIQEDYEKRRRAFDTLFKHQARDEAGSFAYRWECVLARLAAADPQELADEIRRHILIP